VPRESTIGKCRAGGTDIDRALAFIRAKAGENILVEHVAAHVHIPLRTFELDFSAATGSTVGEEIRKAKIARANTLLDTSDLPLDRIAQMCGLVNGINLNKYFRRWTGVSAARRRRNMRSAV
jgi:transcriptional regulator GlxA family with amidase domain